MKKRGITDGPAEALCNELFCAVQTSQGFAFISDGMGAMTKKEFFSNVRHSLRHNRIASRKIYAFLKKHGELKP